MQKDLGPKGFAVLEGAIDDNADIPKFVKEFHPNFPVGMANQLAARFYLQMSPVTREYVPFMVFIDRQGMIRAQFTGTDKELSDGQEDKLLRELAEKLLPEPGAARRKPKRRGQPAANAFRGS